MYNNCHRDRLLMGSRLEHSTEARLLTLASIWMHKDARHMHNKMLYTQTFNDCVIMAVIQSG